MAGLYFAYGSNMDRKQMAARCPGATCHGVAVLAGHRFVINTRGVATVVPAAGGAVHGLVWELTDDDECQLDRYEGVERGLYTRERATVTATDGSTMDVLVYVAADPQPGVPRLDYQELVVAAAGAERLPQDYCEELRSWLF